MPAGFTHHGPGKHITMQNEGTQDADERTHALWSEAALAASAEESLDVRWEARGLMVAEMADVHLADRLAALPLGARISVVNRRGDRLTGDVAAVGTDHLILDGSPTLLIPHGAIGLIGALPRVLRDDSQREDSARDDSAREDSARDDSGRVANSAPRVCGKRTWRSVLQECLGERIAIETAVQRISGHLTWVGHDHLSINDDDDHEVTVPWRVVEAASLPSAR